jgi:HD-GYP domain-containing protein (c-di-GMP phosphodiesterase class II)
VIREGWFRTGGRARKDEDGFCYIVDRKKELIIRDGYNVYPREFEEVPPWIARPRPGLADHAVWRGHRPAPLTITADTWRVDTSTGGLRLSELVAAISLATDLGTGQPVEHALRTCLLSMRVADELGLGREAASEVYYVALLRFLGCTADAPETAYYGGGDHTGLNAAMAPVFMGSSSEVVRRLARNVGHGEPAVRRARLLREAMLDARSVVSHCEVGARLATRLGMAEGVAHALGHAYERWDGRGLPDGLSGEEIPIAVRMVVVARDAVLWRRIAGPEEAERVLQRRRGRAYDPAVVDAVRRVRVTYGDSGQIWEQALDAEPGPVLRVGPVALDRALAAVGDFADLRSRWTRGRSQQVAETAAAAGRACGFAATDVILVRRAALVADLGAVGVPAGLWDRPARLGVEEIERIRLHPYLSERVLGRCGGLRPLAALAGAHHERLDASGYHRGSAAAQLTAPARVLAAADVWTALREARAHRPAWSVAQAMDALRGEVRAGRLDATAADAVLAAAGHGGGRPTSAGRPAGLSEREVEVLALIARGHTNRQVATRLGITAKTVGHHVEHIYAKIGVTTRPAAALFAMEHDILRGTHP